MTPRTFAALAAALVAGIAAAPAHAAAPGTNVLVSRPSAFGPLASPTTNDSFVDVTGTGSQRVVADVNDHRYVAFVSEADGLSDADDNRVENVFVRDNRTAHTILVSRADGPTGAGANANASQPSISADGRFVAFQSFASNLAAGASGNASHVYVRDLLAGTTRLVDRGDNADGAIGNADGFDPAVTAVNDNPVVAFTSSATNLDGATGGFAQVYVRSGNDTEMQSRPNGSAGVPGNGPSSDPSISTDGAFVAFTSAANNLDGANDVNGWSDVFRRTVNATVTVPVSGYGNGAASEPSISGNGAYVAFSSEATTLLPADDNDPGKDVYVRRISPPVYALASQSTGGDAGDDASGGPSLLDTGQTVAFVSDATNLVTGDTNGQSDVFLRSSVFAASPGTGIVSRPAPLVQSDGASDGASIGRAYSATTANLVAFATTADDMGPDDDNDFRQVYGRVVGIVPVTLAPVYISRPDGTAAFRSGVNASYLRSPTRGNENAPASMSADGRYTVFLSAEDDLSTGDDDRFINVYRRDNLTGATTLVSRANGAAGAAANGPSGSAGGGLVSVGAPRPFGTPSISADGNRIAFVSAASNLVANDANNALDVFVRDVAAGTTTLASRRTGGAQVPTASDDPAISADGRHVAFITRTAIDAVADMNIESDVYMRNLDTGTTVLVSRKPNGGPAGGDSSSEPAVDADGTRVAFATDATDFSAVPDTNTASDVWVRDLAADTTTLVSRREQDPAMTGDDASFAPAISADGNRIAFTSAAADLVTTIDVNGGIGDIFLRDVATGTTTLVSRTSGANGISGNDTSDRASIDAAGDRVVFESAASDLVTGDTNGTVDIFLRDAGAGTTDLVSRAPTVLARVPSLTPTISGNGDCIAFETFSDRFVTMPAGTDFSRVVARALRGSCPFGPLAQPPPPPGGGTPDTTKPVLTGVRLKPTRFLAGKRVRKRKGSRPPVGARLRLTLSEAATLTLRFDRLKPGRKRRGRCVAPQRAPRGRACTRAIKRGKITVAGVAGANRIAVTGRIRGKKLAPGRYRLTVRGKDDAGNISARKRLKFQILSPGS
jgi:hypothetical protein